MPSAESAAGAGRIFDMIKSMTGFGRCENHQGSRKFTVEMKAVNHRYFDVSIKMPKKLGFFEEYVKLKMNVANDDLGKFSELNSRIKNRLKKLEDEYVEHI